MRNSLQKFKIPTLLGLGIIILGTAAGVFLVSFGNQNFFTQADVSLKPENIQITNAEDESVTISWQTLKPTSGFVTFGQENPDKQSMLDDKDNKLPTSRTFHHVTLKKLIPQTTYQFKIISGNYNPNQILKFMTSPSKLEQNGYKPIIGSVLDLDGQPLKEGLVYLVVKDAQIQSATIKDLGNFIIPISKMRSQDLSKIFFPAKDTVGKLTISATSGQTNIAFRLTNSDPLGPLQIGKNLDLTIPVIPIFDFDLDDNNIINATDYSIFLKHFSADPPDIKADLNQDGKVNKEDQNLILDKINQQEID